MKESHEESRIAPLLLRLEQGLNNSGPLNKPECHAAFMIAMDNARIDLNHSPTQHTISINGFVNTLRTLSTGMIESDRGYKAFGTLMSWQILLAIASVRLGTIDTMHRNPFFRFFEGADENRLLIEIDQIEDHHDSPYSAHYVQQGAAAILKFIGL